MWADRNYEFLTGPTNFLAGRWGYIQSKLSSGPCKPADLKNIKDLGTKKSGGARTWDSMGEYGGGFEGTLKTDLVVGICCANHHTSLEAAGEGIFPRVNGQKSVAGITWKVHPGKFSMSNHRGKAEDDACTFFEAEVKAGSCESALPLGACHIDRACPLNAPASCPPDHPTRTQTCARPPRVALPDKICCDPGWASGIFVAQKNELKRAAWDTTPFWVNDGAIPCSKFTLDTREENKNGENIRVGSGTCVEGVKINQQMWTGQCPTTPHTPRPSPHRVAQNCSAMCFDL